MSSKQIEAARTYERAIFATSSLLGKFRMQYAFVGGVAESAWLGSKMKTGSVDVVAVVSPEQREMIPKMAANNGFRIDEEALEATRELDLVPLSFVDGETEIPVYVLFATNALYGLMVRDAVTTALGGGELRVVTPEDLATLLAVDEAEDARQKLSRLRLRDGFDTDRFDKRLRSIGLGGQKGT